MKKFITSRIKEKIALNEKDYADAWIAKHFNEGDESAEAKKQVAAAELMMKTAEDRIAKLKSLIKE